MNRIIGMEELEEGIVIRAAYQLSGKGHRGNTWLSEPGKNLLFSILLKPEFLPVDTAFHLSRIVSLALVEVIDKQKLKASIKWPNDILVRSRKICGILIENSIIRNSISHAVIGIGMNVNQEKFDDGIPTPTSLLLEKRCHFDMNLLLEDIRSALERWYQVLLTGNTKQIMDEYLEHLFGLRIPANYSDGETVFRASINNVLPGGELEVLLEGGGIRRFGFREIKFLD